MIEKNTSAMFSDATRVSDLPVLAAGFSIRATGQRPLDGSNSSSPDARSTAAPPTGADTSTRGRTASHVGVSLLEGAEHAFVDGYGDINGG